LEIPVRQFGKLLGGQYCHLFKHLSRFFQRASPIFQLIDRQTSCESRPGNPTAWINLAYAVRRAENIEQAEAILLKARKLNPKSALIIFNLACYASVAGHMEEAKARLQGAIDLDKTFDAWHSMTKISGPCGTGSVGFLDL
jgi:tetratricopeptide (TPR) repeat protein